MLKFPGERGKLNGEYIFEGSFGKLMLFCFCQSQPTLKQKCLQVFANILPEHGNLRLQAILSNLDNDNFELSDGFAMPQASQLQVWI